jgi:hypothetical protein
VNGAVPEELDRLFQADRVRACIVRAAGSADRLDREAMATCFWSGATIRYGGWAHWSLDEFVDAWLELAHACVATQQHLFNHRLEIRGDTAHCESYYVAVLVPAEGAPDGVFLPFCAPVAAGRVAFQGGRYVDRLERRDGEWRIAARQVCCDWVATADSAAEPAGGPTSTRTRDDPQPRPQPPVAGEPLGKLLAAEAVRDCLFRSARGLDRLDLDLVSSSFAGAGAGEAAAGCMRRHGDTRPTQSHYVTNVSVRVDGESAAAEAYVLAVHRDAGAGGSSTSPVVHLRGGRYAVDLTTVADEWRIVRTAMLGEWRAAADARFLDAFVRATGARSARNHEDPSYHPPVVDGTSRTAAGLLDREAIRDCLARYARGVDRLDRDLVQSSFAGDASAVIDSIFGQAAARPVQNHCFTNLRVQIDGDAAIAEAYYLTVIGYAEGAGHGLDGGAPSSHDINLVGGRYVIPLVRRDSGGWTMKARGNVGDWHAVIDGSALPDYRRATGAAHQPRGSRLDPSYTRV